MRSGAVGRSVTALVKDVRRMMEPNTASNLKVSTVFQIVEKLHRAKSNLWTTGA